MRCVASGAVSYAAADPYSGACHVEIDIPVVRNAPIAIQGPLAGWPSLLSQSLVVANWHSRQDIPSFRVIELFGPAAHVSAGRLRELEPRLDLGAGLQAVLPALLREVL